VFKSLEIQITKSPAQICRFIEGSVALVPGSGGGVLRRARAGAILYQTRRSHVRGPGSGVLVVQKKLRRRMAAVDRAGGRSSGQTFVSGQSASHIRRGKGTRSGGQRVPRQRFSGRCRTGNQILFPKQYAPIFRTIL